MRGIEPNKTARNPLEQRPPASSKTIKPHTVIEASKLRVGHHVMQIPLGDLIARTR
jgi:hypothetical protein